MKKNLSKMMLVCAVLAALLSTQRVQAAAKITLGNDINLSKLAGQEADVSVAINPLDGKNIVVVSSHLSGGTSGLFRAYSKDGGTTWTNSLIGTGTDPIYPASANPTCAFDSFGNLFVAYESSANAPVVVVSIDGGVNFSKVAQLDTTGRFPKVATGTGLTSGSGAVWVAFQDTNRSVAVCGLPVTALNTFGAFTAKSVVPNSQFKNWCSVAVGVNGQVAVAYQSDVANAQGPDTINFSIDADGFGPGTFSAPTILTSTNVGSSDSMAGASGIHANINLVYDTSAGGSYRGRLYAVYVDEFPNESDNMDIQLRYSDNNGTTWSTAAKVNNDTTQYAQFMCAAALDPFTGALGIIWYDNRGDSGTGAANGVDHDGQANTDSQVWGTISIDGGVTFLPQFQVSNGSSEGFAVPTLSEYGNYIGLAFVNNEFVPAWADNSNSTGDNPDGPQSYMDAYVIVAAVDPGSVIPPTPAKSDLYVSNVVFASPPLPGQSFKVIATVVNAGPGGAPSFFVSAFNDPSNVSFTEVLKTDFLDPNNYVSGSPLLGCTPQFAAAKKVDIQEVRGGLTVGGSIDVVLEMMYCDGGSYTMSILANSQRNAYEGNYFNNQFNLNVTVPSPTIDLTLTNLQVVDTTPGTDATFTVEVRNFGLKPSGPVIVGFYENRASAPTSFDVPDQIKPLSNLLYNPISQPVIAANKITFTLKTQASPRAGRAWIFVDYGNTVTETNEDNNIVSGIWGIANTPPAVLSGATSSAQSPAVGENVTFSVSAADPNGDSLWYVWDFGDGTPPQTAGPTVTHAFVASGVFNVTVTIADGPFNSVQSVVKVDVLSSTIVDLGFVVAKSGYIKLAVPVPPGFEAKDHAKGKIVEGSAGDQVAFKSLRLSGRPGNAGVYTFTVEYISVKSKKANRVRYKYTVL